MSRFVTHHRKKWGCSSAWVAGAAILLVTVGSAFAEPAKCDACHQAEGDDLFRSVHSKLQCQECHGGNEAYDLSAAELAGFVPLSGDVRPPFDHGSTFRGRLTRASSPHLCGDCHGDVERMNPYGLRTDQLTRYMTSIHGKKLREGDERVAVCLDCHGVHGIRSGREPDSRTHPLNVPSTCARCHEDPELMAPYGLATEIVEEYRQSVHGRLLLGQKDTGSPTCATCHGNHSAMPPGFATVRAVCGQCHDHVTKYFEMSIHATQEEHKGCIQCHGGGEGRHFHLIERITRTPGLMIQRYAHLMESAPDSTAAEIAEAINPNPRKIITRALPTCTVCHDDPDEDESLPRLFALLDEISEAERYFVRTASRLDQVGQGVLLVENQRFKFEDAKTHLIGLEPLQHTLDNALVAEKVAALNSVCDKVNVELDELEAGLRWRYRALVPIWGLAILFAGVLYAKYRQLRAAWVKPLPEDSIG